jgi:hypothetical protein
MKVYKASIQRKDIEALPKNEIIFFIQACRILNDINILHKTTTISNHNVESEVERKAQNSQSLFFLMLLTGKLFEGWELLQKSFFGSKLSKKYENLLPEDAQNSLRDLKNYFGKKENLIKKVRNKIAFHYDSEEILEQINKLPQDEDLEIYLTEHQGNCFYYIPNVLLINAIINWIGISDPLQAIDRYFAEVTNVARWYINFLNHCLPNMAEKDMNWDLKEIDIPDPPAINDLVLPYFIGKPLKRESQDRNNKPV